MSDVGNPVLRQWERHPRRFPGQPSQDAELGALRLGQQLRQRVRLRAKSLQCICARPYVAPSSCLLALTCHKSQLARSAACAVHLFEPNSALLQSAPA